MKIQWTKDHKSTCGRFWLYKAPRADEWCIFDRRYKDVQGNTKRINGGRKIADAKARCQYIVDNGI